jgi:hypothetical protein
VTVSPRYYITESPWLISIQIGWEEQIYNRKLPYWMRTYAVAMARSEPNLHTQLQPGELAKLLGTPQPDGTVKPVDRRDLSEYVKRAVEMNLLDETSSVRCLVLPATTTANRRPGFNSACSYHSGKSSKIKKRIAIKQKVSTPVNGANSNVAVTTEAAGQVGCTNSAVGPLTRHCRADNPTTITSGSRDIFTVQPRRAEGAPV